MGENKVIQIAISSGSDSDAPDGIFILLESGEIFQSYDAGCNWRAITLPKD